MMFDSKLVLILTTKLSAFNLLISTLEYISLSKSEKIEYIWNPNTILKDYSLFPNTINQIYSFYFRPDNFRILLWIRLILTLIMLFSISKIIISVNLILSIIILQKFRGTFNGGSDYMSILTLIVITFCQFFKNSPNLVHGALFYLAIQLILSYFFAGIVKIRNREWIMGSAVKEIVTGPNFAPPFLIKKLFLNHKVSFLSGWTIISLELLFPLILFSKYPIFILMIAFIFHLMNFILFGLNRFVWAWLATYPALLFFIRFLNIGIP